MSDPGAFDEAALADWRALADEFAESAGGDLTSLLGCEVGLGTPVVEEVDHEEATRHPGPIVHLRGRVGGEPGQALHLLLGAADAITVAGLQLGHEPAEIEPARKGVIDDAHLAGLGGAMKLVTAVLGRLMAEKLELEDLETEAPVSLPEPVVGGRWLGPGPYLRLCFDLAVEGFDRGSLMLLVGAPPGGADAGEAEEIGEGPLLLLDPDAGFRDAARELGDSLGRDVLALDPADMPAFDDELFERAAAFVLAWNLGGRSGLETLEAMRRRSNTCDKPILLAAEAPTRGMVRAALRAGATGFVLRPYSLDELHARGLG